MGKNYKIYYRLFRKRFFPSPRLINALKKKNIYFSLIKIPFTKNLVNPEEKFINKDYKKH